FLCSRKFRLQFIKLPLKLDGKPLGFLRRERGRLRLVLGLLSFLVRTPPSLEIRVCCLVIPVCRGPSFLRLLVFGLSLPLRCIPFIFRLNPRSFGSRPLSHRLVPFFLRSLHTSNGFVQLPG